MALRCPVSQSHTYSWQRLTPTVGRLFIRFGWTMHRFKWPRNRFHVENYTFGQSLSCSVISLKPIKHRDATRDECGVKKHKSNVNYIISVVCSRCEQYERLMNQPSSRRNYHTTNQPATLFLSTRCKSGFCTSVSVFHMISSHIYS